MPSLVALGPGTQPLPGRDAEFVVCLPVRHALERQSLRERLRPEVVGTQKRFDIVG